MIDLRSHLHGSSQFFYWLVTTSAVPELVNEIAFDLELGLSVPRQSSSKNDWLAWGANRGELASLNAQIEDAFAQFEAWKKEQWRARQAARQPVKDDLV